MASLGVSGKLKSLAGRIRINSLKMMDRHDLWNVLVRGIIPTYLGIEIAFYFVFCFYLIPRANQRTTPRPYRDYGRDRHQLLLRILDRMEQTYQKKNLQSRIEKFLLEWFREKTEPERIQGIQREEQQRQESAVVPNSTASETSSLGSDDDREMSGSLNTESSYGFGTQNSVTTASEHTASAPRTWTIKGLGKDDTDEFFSWAFFGKHRHQLDDWEVEELELCYTQIEKREGLVFQSGSQHKFTPRRLTLEDVNPLHRPLLVYIAVAFCKTAAGLLLRFCGFRRIISEKTGLVGWHRPARDAASEKLLPLLFFHGIAPGGLLFYLPMLISGLSRDGRSLMMFENKSISCSMDFSALTEHQTILGVEELVEKYLPSNVGLSLVGHSFGSCQLTWLLHSSLRKRIRQFTLMDPVTILLSEPDVMINFLYSQEVSKIRLVASSELFTEYYLRRHFSWYNSELWLDDIPKDIKVLVALSEHDEIINSPKVKKALDQYASENVEVLYWKHVGHADCVSSPRKWREMKDRMLRQELSLAKTQCVS